MKNKMIIQAEAAIDAKVPAADKQAYDKIVLAGQKVMFEEGGPHAELVQGLMDAPDKVSATVNGIIGILGTLFKQSRGTMPVAPMLLAGQSLLMEALDFMEEGGMIEVTPEILGEATRLYIEGVLPRIGMTPDKMKQVLGHAQGIMSDPQKMGQFKQSAGK